MVKQTITYTDLVRWGACDTAVDAWGMKWADHAVPLSDALEWAIRRNRWEWVGYYLGNERPALHRPLLLLTLEYTVPKWPDLARLREPLALLRVSGIGSIDQDRACTALFGAVVSFEGWAQQPPDVPWRYLAGLRACLRRLTPFSTSNRRGIAYQDTDDPVLRGVRWGCLLQGWVVEEGVPAELLLIGFLRGLLQRQALGATFGEEVG